MSPLELVLDDGKIRVEEKIHAYWKAQGCRTATLADIYNADLTEEQLERIQAICKETFLFVADVYAPGAEVSVNGGEWVEFSEYSKVSIREVLESKVGLTLIQQLCGTNDDAETIQLKLKKLIGMNCEMFFHTFRGYALIKVWLYYFNDGFHLACCCYTTGRSFGVCER